MIDLIKSFDGSKAGIVVADDNMKVVWANRKSKNIFKAALNLENFIGQNLTELHNAKTVEKIKSLYKEFKEKKRSIYHYTVKTHGRTTTIVIVPFYDGEQFSGAIETIFEGTLA